MTVDLLSILIGVIIGSVFSIVYFVYTGSKLNWKR